METEWNDATAAFLAKIGVAGGGIISSNKNELLTRNEMRFDIVLLNFLFFLFS